MSIVKAGRELIVPEGAMQGPGRMTRVCRDMCCRTAPKHERYTLLPCGCHALQNHCTCKLRDRLCRGCRRVFVACGGDWYEIQDPHPAPPPREP